ncbi:MAG: bifunctional demethylmenaquinone methyltransferase/2-methoxy-6-polyprenyl-1,4-benzoquinol methylase UbiE [Nitrospinae bacterium]|nr:bifunctional demethylmenaquinone methyltransferase/2-methoxy-6-polyprenyl-1,4-benzoquinol methylase UbiE [Nitrospinota bacterium]
MSSSQVKQGFNAPVDRANPIQDMFNAVAPRYDFLNGLLSAGCDRYWRKAAVDELEPIANRFFLDVATGTADIALELALRNKSRVIGVDFSTAMLKLGNNKINTRRMQSSVQLFPGAAENLPLKSNSFDGAISAFGARNFADIDHAISEIHRVLKPKGKIVILEFSFPQNGFLQWLYRLYFEKILPVMGRWVSGHKSAYTYLPDSVGAFPKGEAFASILIKSGFESVAFKELTFGITTIYTGFKHA